MGRVLPFTPADLIKATGDRFAAGLVATARAEERARYWPGELNHCMACTGTAWWVGRHSAECHGCGAVLPMDRPFQQGELSWPK
jgi:hypothetical protein